MKLYKSAKRLTLFFSFTLIFLASSHVQASRVVVAFDEWPMSETSEVQVGTANVAHYAANVANFLTGNTPGSIYIFSANFGLVSNTVETAITDEGHTLTYHSGGQLTLAQLQTYDAVFLGGNTAGLAQSQQAIFDYAADGGNIYLAAGAGGFGSGAANFEADFWNPMLGLFDFSLANTYDAGNEGIDDMTSDPHFIFTDVDGLFYRNGQIISSTGSDPLAQIYFDGHYAVYDGTAVVPIPAGIWLFGSALIGLVGLRNRT